MILSKQEENAVMNQLILFVQRIINLRIPVEFSRGVCVWRGRGGEGRGGGVGLERVDGRKGEKVQIKEWTRSGRGDILPL